MDDGDGKASPPPIPTGDGAPVATPSAKDFHVFGAAGGPSGLGMGTTVGHDIRAHSGFVPAGGGPGQTTTEGAKPKKPKVLAEVSKNLSGIIDVGSETDKHRLGTDGDGHAINSAHLPLFVYLRLDDTIDGPMGFNGPYEISEKGPKRMETHFEFDAGMSHGFVCGSRPGVFRWHSYCFIGCPPEEPPPPPGVPDPPSGPPPVPTGPGLPVGGGDNGGIFGPGFGFPNAGGTPSAGASGGDQGPLPGTFGPNPFQPFPDNPLPESPAYGPQGVNAPTFQPWQQGMPPLRIGIGAMETSFPSILGRPQLAQTGATDFRNWLSQSDGAVLHNDYSTPVIGRIESFGKQLLGDWAYTYRPGRGARYRSGTASGGWCIMSAEVGMEDSGTTFAPPLRSLSTVYFGVLTGNYFAAGLPDTSTGGYKTGFRWGKSGNYLNFDAMSSAGALAAQIFRMSSVTDYQAEAQLGLGGLYASLMGALNEDFSTVGTDANTSVKTLYSLSVTANSLNNVGKGFTFRFAGSFAANANVKTLAVTYAGTQICTNDITTNPNGLDYEIEGEVSQISATVAYATVRMNLGGVKQGVEFTSVAASFGSANTLALTGQNGTAAANDIVKNYATVKGIT